MNWRFLAAAWLCAVAAVPCGAATFLPGIGGSVRPSGTGAAIAGVRVQLFQDDGDGTFDASSDMQVGSDTLSDADGRYYFDELNPDARYFVFRPAQQVLGANLDSDVSGLLSPAVPLQIIDTFDNHQVVQANPMNPSSTSAVSNLASSAIGGERDLMVKLMSGVGKVSLRSNAFGVDVLQYDSTSVMGYGLVTWDGVDFSAKVTPALGLGNLDLTESGQATGLLLKLGIDLTGTGERLRFRLFGDSATEYSEASLEIPVTGGAATGMAFLPFDEFVGSVSPDHVNAIQLLLGEGSKSVDAQIDWIGTAGPTRYDFVVVPEPTAAGLTVLALLLLGCVRRRYQ